MQPNPPIDTTLSLSERLAAAESFERLIYTRDLFGFARDLCGYKDLAWPTHRAVIDALESPTKRKLIVMPRGTFKSSLCSVAYPLWLLCGNPDLRIMLDSELYSNSKNFLREIKMHMQSPRIEELFGRFHNPECWNESEIIIRQRQAVRKEASITASGIGAQKTGMHYDVIICDDLNSPTNSTTPEAQEKVIAHYRYNQAILEPDGVMVVVATRYSAMDIPGFILRSEIGLMSDEEKKAREGNAAEASNAPGSGYSDAQSQSGYSHPSGSGVTIS